MNSYEPGLAALPEQGRDERGLGVGRRLLLPLAVVARAPLAAEEPEHEHDDEERGHRREDGEHEQRAERARDPLVDALAVFLEVRRVLGLLVDDPVETRPLLDPHPGRRGERLAWVQRAELDELLAAGTSSARRRTCDPASVTSPRTQTGCPHARTTSPGPAHRGGERAEALLPLVAPDLEVDVDDVVVRDGEAGEAVADREGAGLVRRLEAPDDAGAAAEVLDAERAGRAAGLELGGGAWSVGGPALGDGDPEISSPSRYGISRKPYVNWKPPPKATVIRSSTAIDPSGPTWARTSVVASSYDCACADGATASAATAAAATARSPRPAPRVAPPPRPRRTRES